MAYRDWIIVAANKPIDFKDPLYIKIGLDTALKKEKEKYEKCPVIPDMVRDFVTAQGWGYVVAGYILVEQAFKALLHVRGKPVRKIHSLSDLFDLIDREDKEVLREYYTDFKMIIGGNTGQFPFQTLDDFLVNLDGDKDGRGNYIGSFAWRYFLIEEKRNWAMPSVSVEYLHEIVLACIQIIRFANNGGIEPSRQTRSWRMHEERQEKYRFWLTVRMKSDGWDDLDDRLEILWGPDDYLGRYDLCLSTGKTHKIRFSKIPEGSEVPIIDKRKEMRPSMPKKDFGYRSNMPHISVHKCKWSIRVRRGDNRSPKMPLTRRHR